MFGILKICGCQYWYSHSRQSARKDCATLIHLGDIDQGSDRYTSFKQRVYKSGRQEMKEKSLAMHVRMTIKFIFTSP